MSRVENEFKALKENAELVQKYHIKDAKTFGRFIVDGQMIADLKRYKKEAKFNFNTLEDKQRKLIEDLALLDAAIEQFKKDI